eukprot:scaffold523736_cov44-Prasinocladus_malaysianus.AAC.1
MSEDNHQTASKVLAASAQHFAGRDSQQYGNCLLYVFSSAESAAKFAMVAQAAFMTTDFPDTDGLDDTEYANTELSPLFRGPRVSMVVHFGDVRVTKISAVSSGKLDPLGNMVEGYHISNMISSFAVRGEALHVARAVMDVLHPGQVVLTDMAWHNVQAVAMS